MHGIGRALPELAGVGQDGVARPEFKLVGHDAAQGGFEDGIHVHMVIQRGRDEMCIRDSLYAARGKNHAWIPRFPSANRKIHFILVYHLACSLSTKTVRIRRY